MGLYERFGTERDLEEQGQWVDFGDGVELRVASASSKRADRAIEQHRRKHHRHYISGKTIPFEVREDAEVTVAVAVITEWRGPGITDAAGQPLEYSKAAAVQLMTDLRELRDQVLFTARQAETFRKERLDDLGKTLSPSSAETPSIPTSETR